MASQTKGDVPPNSSGISVIVVGLGYAGAVAAVECYRKGHHVTVFEQTSRVSEGGDMIGITANAAHVIANWGGGSVHRQFQDIICVIEEFTLYNSKGEYLLTQNMPGFSKDTGYMGKRSEFLKIMCDHVASLGIKIHRGKRITEYFETQSEAGICCDGKKFSADCVLACDGVNSKGRGTVLGDVGKPHPTGYATYRAWYDAASLKEDPNTQWIVAGDIDKSIAFIGPDVHCIFGTAKRCKEMTWVLTHLDSDDIQESWTLPGRLEDALKVVQGWDPRVAAIISHTPEGQLIDHKLLWRDPLPRWVSNYGRILLVGDSAHTFLPTSIQGAGQAIEDAATVAICLQLAGKDQIPTALRTSQKMRYDRVGLTQRMGVETRDIWHRTDWAHFKEDNSYLQLPQPDWIFGHDPQKYAYEEFAAAAHAVETGCPYQQRNVPMGNTKTRGNDFDAAKKSFHALNTPSLVPPVPSVRA